MRQTATHKSYPALADELCRQNRIGILVSGGCDSEVLLRAAADVLGGTNAIAFTAVTPFIAPYYTEIVQAAAGELGVKLVQVRLNPLDTESIKQNTSQRCYHCKKAIYSTIKAEAERNYIAVLADGTNMDDMTEYRPGLKAAGELDIHHPFITAKMTKADIRELGRLLNMNNPDRPSDSCLATRIPEQTPITPEAVALISRIEQPLRPQVKGRLRAGVIDKQITVYYQAIDKELINIHRQALERTACISSCSIEFQEVT